MKKLLTLIMTVGSAVASESPKALRRSEEVIAVTSILVAVCGTTGKSVHSECRLNARLGQKCVVCNQFCGMNDAYAMLLKTEVCEICGKPLAPTSAPVDSDPKA